MIDAAFPLAACPRCGLPCMLVESGRRDKRLLMRDGSNRPHACAVPVTVIRTKPLEACA